MTYRMNPALRDELLSGVMGEGWDEGYKEELHEEISRYADGDEIFYAKNDEGAVDEVTAPVASLIEYFGVEHLAHVCAPKTIDYASLEQKLNEAYATVRRNRFMDDERPDE